jgi:hypothetical protein
MEMLCIVRFGSPKQGREGAAMAFAARQEQECDRMVAEGVLTSWEWIVNTTGPEDDMLVMRGSPEAISAMMASPESAATVAEGQYLLEDFRVDLGVAGRADQVYAAWSAVLAVEAGAPAE